jgi:spore germination protein GerM
VRRRNRFGSLLVVTVLAAGCGVPNDHDAHVVEIGSFVADVEQGLTAQPPVDDDDGAVISVYMIAPGAGRHLVAVERIVPYPSLELIMKHLFQGPVGDEWAKEVRSAISTQARVRDVIIFDGQATIDIDGPLTDLLGGFEIILALAQIVGTATEVPGIDRVRLQLDGEEMTDALTEDGTSTSGALTRKDYANLLPK